MKVILQRVSEAEVRVHSQVVGAINSGLLILVGIHQDDTPAELSWMADKVAGLRIFRDAAGKMNLSVGDAQGAILAVSQFTLFADTKKGKRPSFGAAARPEQAKALFDDFCNLLRAHDLKVETGIFGADMQVKLVNDGPVTIPIERNA
ncbi:MAG: D-aminoacyl-tRNA deacylase [Planctomycetota bacterium]